MTVDPQSLQLRPAQREAVGRFFEPGAPERQVLLAPPGTGKSVIASAVAEEGFRRGAQSILVLAAQNVVAQSVAWRAAGQSRTPFELHRALSSSTAARPQARWPEEVLAFGSLRRAAREPVAGALRARGWDLLIVDLSGASHEDVETLKSLVGGSRFERVLALDNALSLPDVWSWLNVSPLAFDVPNVEGMLSPPLRFSVVRYHRSQAEIAIAGRVQQLAMMLRQAAPRLRQRLPAAAASSPLALQSQSWAVAEDLRYVRNRLAHGLPSAPQEQLELEIEPSQLPLVPTQLPIVEELRRDLMALADDVDQLDTDTKWLAFVNAFSERSDATAVVMCDFPETATYVADRLQTEDVEALPVVDEASLRTAASTSGMVLVVADDLLPGLDLRWARVAYNYDLPASQRRAHIRWSRLDWWHQDPQPEMVTLLDKTSATATEKMAFTQLRYMVGAD